MTQNTAPSLKQEFQIGQRVQHRVHTGLVGVFTIGSIHIFYSGEGPRLMYAADLGKYAYRGPNLVLCKVQTPYVASARAVISRDKDQAAWPEGYRCETDEEMDDRHALERAAYDEPDL